MKETYIKPVPALGTNERPQISRRSFLGVAGLGTAAVAITVAGCSKDDDGVGFGSGDTAILNYAYALEQLEAAFYTQVMATPYASMPAIESSYLSDIQKHEVAHREFFKSVLGSNAIPALEVDFSSINFLSRDSVLAAARSFEDTGVAAYNGAGRFLTNAANLGFAGKIVSVEARHAAIIRNLISYGSFADDSILDATTRQDVVMRPRAVMSIVSPFVKTKLDTNSLPS